MIKGMLLLLTKSNAAAAAVSALPSALVDEIPDATEEPDNFEEAIGVADGSGKHSKEEKEVKVMADQEVQKGRQGQLDSSHLDGVHSGETDGDMVSPEDRDVVDVNSGLSSEKAGNEDPEYMTPGQYGGMLLENGSIDKVDFNVAEFHTESESNEEMPNQGADAGNLQEGGLAPEFKDDKIEEQLNASGHPYSEIQDDTGEKVREYSAHRDLELQGEKFLKMQDETLGTGMILVDRNGKEMRISDSQSTECKDYTNDETKDAKAGSDSEHLEAIRETGGASPATEEGNLILTIGSSSFSENSFADEILTAQATAADLKEGSTMDYRSEISNEDNHGNYENLSVVGKPEKTPQNNAKGKETTQITKEQNSELVSSSGKTVATSPPLVRPAGLGHAALLLEPASRVVQHPRANCTVCNTQSMKMEDSSTGEAEEYDETREKLQMIRVKFLRLAHRLGQTPHNVVVAQVLYRLGLAEQLRGRNGGRVGAFSLDRASAMAEQLEAAGQEPLDFSCTIMVLGKIGVGKSATVNSIFDEVKFNTDAFHMGTKKVQDVVGTVQGIKVRVIDTPGLLPSWSDQRHNEKILHSVKRFIKKTPPDIVLYLDRLDMQSRDFSDMPL